MVYDKNTYFVLSLKLCGGCQERVPVMEKMLNDILGKRKNYFGYHHLLKKLVPKNCTFPNPRQVVKGVDVVVEEFWQMY